MDMVFPALKPKMELVGNLHQHFHRRMHRADDPDIAGLVEGDRRRVSGRDRAEVEYMARRRGQPVVEDVVVVQEHEGFALLERDLGLRKHLAFLADRSLGGERHRRAGKKRNSDRQFHRPGHNHRRRLLWITERGHRGSTGTVVGSTLLVSVCMNATKSDFSWALSLSGRMRFERLGRSMPAWS